MELDGVDTRTGPSITGLLESALYVKDVGRSCAFYEALFRFKSLIHEKQFAVLHIVPGQVLLLFEHGWARMPAKTPGGVIPPHDGSGELHLAFAIPKADLEAWEERLPEHSVAVESKVRWDRGATSIYFRDPDGHLVELVTPGLWPE